MTRDRWLLIGLLLLAGVGFAAQTIYMHQPAPARTVRTRIKLVPCGDKLDQEPLVVSSAGQDFCLDEKMKAAVETALARP